ncbi:MAG: alpha/beta fold hydrolase [Pseudomonadota bacterium]
MKTLAKIVGALVALFVVYLALDRALPEPMARGQIALQRTVSGLELKSAEIPGFTIPYLEGGSAEGEPLVLVHGFAADKDNFDLAAMFLTRKMRVIALDLPGFGDASKPADADYSIGKQVERLDQFLTQLGITKAHFGGNSMGGWIIGTYAAAHPEKVSSLWLVDAAGVHTAKTSPLRQTYEKTGEIKLVAKNLEEFEAIAALAMEKQPPLPYSIRYVLAQRAAADYELHSRIFRELAASHETAALEQRVKGLATPTLITWGDQDHLTDVSGAEILHGVLPNSQVNIFNGIGHLPQVEVPHPAAKAYLEFRSGLGA